MLYDPQWEAKTKTASLAGLIAWLETQDPATQYDWMDTGDCLMCRYGHSIGLDVRTAGGDYWKLGRDLKIVEWPDGCAEASCNGERTYGAALARARALAG